MTKKNNLAVIEKSTQDILNLLTIPTEIKITQTEDEIYQIDLQTENSGLLIGFHGDTLFSLQLIIALISYKQIGEWLKISVNVGNYREYREEQLSGMVNRIIEEVKQSGQSQSLPFLSGSERRIVHLLLQDNPNVVSESEGEGKNRRLFIKPKTNIPTNS